MLDVRGQVIRSDIFKMEQRFINAVSIKTTDMNVNNVNSTDFTTDNNFGNALKKRVGVSCVRTSKNKVGISSEHLSSNLMISPEAAKLTVECTTQRCVRTPLKPTLSCQYSS